jgi:hypothetical protein
MIMGFDEDDSIVSFCFNVLFSLPDNSKSTSIDFYSSNFLTYLGDVALMNFGEVIYF